MKPITFVCIVIYVLACIQVEVKAFSSPQDCIDKINELVKDKRSELSTDYLLMNYHTKRALADMCNYYVPHKVHEVLKLVNKENCPTGIPTTQEFDKSIYNAYVELLQILTSYEGRDIPNSFSQHTDHVIGATNAVFERTLDRLAGVCLHKSADEI